MLTYIHIGRCVSEPPACWGLPASPSSSSAARSWPDRPSCHRQRALSCGQWSCSLGSSTQSAPFRPFSAAIDDHEITAAGRPGSWAESPSPHTLSCSPSWCSLDYYLASTRCARHASQTCVPGWPKPATIPVALPHTLRAASRLLAFAQDTGRLVATGRLCRRAASSCCPSSSRRRPWPSPRSPRRRGHCRSAALTPASLAFAAGAVSSVAPCTDAATLMRISVLCVCGTPRRVSTWPSPASARGLGGVFLVRVA